MSVYPDRFVDDSYLKYIGWTFNDKESVVRRKCLQLAQLLFENEALLAQLKLFSSKFKDRIVEMTGDADLDCSIRAVRIICAIDKWVYRHLLEFSIFYGILTLSLGIDILLLTWMAFLIHDWSIVQSIDWLIDSYFESHSRDRLFGWFIYWVWFINWLIDLSLKHAIWFLSWFKCVG